MTNEANRAILLTPAGPAAIAVVRLVGPAVGDFLRRHFSPPAVEGRCVHGVLSDGGRIIDDPVVALGVGGGWADVNLHGGPWVVQAMLDLARRKGLEVVAPAIPLAADAAEGESELEREVHAYLPLARTELALRVLLAQPAAWANVVRKPSPQEIRSILDDRALHHLLHLPRIAIIGAPNVGKSTLANQLFAQERSITADLPGTTRDWIGEIANLDGLAVMLVDTPGLRATEDPIERQAIARSGGQIGAADLVVLVLEASRPADPEQSPLMAAYPEALQVINKADLARNGVEFAGSDAVRTVATTGEGIDGLRRAIRRRFGCERVEVGRPRWWTPRQRSILEQAVDDPSVLMRICE